MYPPCHIWAAQGAGMLVGGASKQPSTMQETAITGYALAVGRAGGGLGRGKNTIG